MDYDCSLTQRTRFPHDLSRSQIPLVLMSTNFYTPQTKEYLRMKTLANLCLFCVARNLEQLSRVGKYLTRIDKEILLEWLCDHDGFTAERLPSITYNLISPQLQHISFRYNEQINDGLLNKLAVSGCRLKSITITRCPNVTDQGVKQLLKSQKKLEFIKLKPTKKTQHSFSDAALSTLKSSSLKVAILKGCDNLTSSGIATLVKNCQNVEHLSLVRCTKIGDEAIQQSANVLRESLEILVVSSVYLLTDVALVALGNGSCPNLRELYVDSCHLLSAYGLKAVSTGCPKLSHLDIGYCYRMLQEGNSRRPIEVTSFPVTLTELTLHGVQLTDHFLTRLVKHLSSISVLRLCGLESLDDSVLQRICYKAGKRLLELNLSLCSKVSDAGLHSVAQHCTAMESISLSCCRNITGVKLKPLFADKKRAADIKLLMVNGSKLFSVDVVHLAVTSCHNLEVLSVAGVSGVDDPLLVSIAENCPKLKIVNVKGCKQVTDSGVCELARLCPLEEIVLAGLNLLTDKTVFAIANNCPTTMRKIYLSGCNMITKAALNYLTDFCVKRIYIEHRTPSADPDQLMAKNLDTGEFCRADLMLRNHLPTGPPSYEDPDWQF